MESPEDEDDLKLVKASAGLLLELESALPKILWKPSRLGAVHGSVHTEVRRRDLEHVIKLIEPFQGEPQLLDARLKTILPPIVDAYVEWLQLKSIGRQTEHLDLQAAVAIILYTLCKVRGYRVILGFLNNEPRYLEPILTQLEHFVARKDDESGAEWQVQYVLLLWLSHLLLTPFDLASISDQRLPMDDLKDVEYYGDLPPLAQRILRIGLHFLPASTKAQGAAALLLVRLVTRPDMLKLGLADSVVSRFVNLAHQQTSDVPVTVYEQLGPLRFLSGISASAEVGHSLPIIYHACAQLSSGASTVVSNAVGKKLILKIFRNIAIVCLHSATTQNSLLSFLERTNALENVIDYLLQALGDRDTPVRFAAAKALSRIILELDQSMGYEVIQAVIDMFREDMPRHSHEMLDFRTANALKWHGLTLALSHALFKRSASPAQLPQIVDALIAALQFEQRTATGSSVGTNVRDAANFGLWALSRRYTTDELLFVDVAAVKLLHSTGAKDSVIQGVAMQLVLAACLDPVGNIRRGSSAALQELIGRHPDQVYDGIALVQIVDYQAVGLRSRAMTDVAFCAGELYEIYWGALVEALLDWRGVGSVDVDSREAAATALARLSTSNSDYDHTVLRKTRERLLGRHSGDFEGFHGLVLSLARLLDEETVATNRNGSIVNGQDKKLRSIQDCWVALETIEMSTKAFSTRLQRSQLPSAAARLLGALCRYQLRSKSDNAKIPFSTVDIMTDRLLARDERSIQRAVPYLVKALLALKRDAGVPLGNIGADALCKKVAIDGSKSTLLGACRAVALGALAALYHGGLNDEKAASSARILGELTGAMNVDWRVVGVKSLQLALESINAEDAISDEASQTFCSAVHQGLNDYTIDERGDVGSLVRLQAIACTSCILRLNAFQTRPDLLQLLHRDIYRLSLEKLDRVRLEAAQCRRLFLDAHIHAADVASVSSEAYFTQALRPLAQRREPEWKYAALLEGCVSCIGVSAEPLLQASRSALVQVLSAIDQESMNNLMETFASILKSLVTKAANAHPTLELLAFLLDMQLAQRLVTPSADFNWRNLLSTVQKSHHKSNDIPKILAAVHVYRGLADIPTIRNEVFKKLISMEKTNPYPRIRSSVAETLFVITTEVS